MTPSWTLWHWKSFIWVSDQEQFLEAFSTHSNFKDINKIKLLSGQAFRTLGKINSLFLKTNLCIDEDFLTKDRIAGMPQVVTSKCGFTSPSLVESTTTTPNPDKPDLKQDEIVRLEKDLEACRAAEVKSDPQMSLMKEHFDGQTVLMKELYDKLELQLKETFEAKLELKLQEIQGLNDKLQIQTSEVNEKNNEIEQCKKKNEIHQSNGQW